MCRIYNVYLKNGICYSIRLTVKPQNRFGKILTLKETVRPPLCSFCTRLKTKHVKNLLHKLLGLRIKNIHVVNHDDGSWRFAVIVR